MLGPLRRFAILVVGAAATACSTGSSTGPATPCFADPPLAGAMCTAEGTRCLYGDQCSTTAFECSGGRWLDQTPEAGTLSCPTVPPPTGALCPQCQGRTYSCGYASPCADGGTAQAVCSVGRWIVGGVCNDGGTNDAEAGTSGDGDPSDTSNGAD